MNDLRTATDQMGREVVFSLPPKRIISLVPSQTEFLVDIGAPIVGRTKFCVHPLDRMKNIEIIGGTKNFKFQKIKELNPDLIIGNKEENYKEGIDQLMIDFPVWMSDIYTLEDSFKMMQSLGEICNLQERSEGVISACSHSLEKVKGQFSGRVIYLIWKNPWMAAGRNTFIDHMLDFLGYENLIKDDRYPEITHQEIQELNPDKILLSSEPFPFNDSHVEEARQLLHPSVCELVDGEMYSWYGSRLRAWRIDL